MRLDLATLAPVLEPVIRRTLRRHESLVRRCRLDADDVVQRVFERMLAAPPEASEIVVLSAWARSVAINYLFDLSKRVGREDAGEDERYIDAPQERHHQAHEQWKRARACADVELAKYKYLRELFYAIADEPDLGARELAHRIGLLGAGATEDEARRAEQYVWKLRQRVQEKLADHLEER